MKAAYVAPGERRNSITSIAKRHILVVLKLRLSEVTYRDINKDINLQSFYLTPLDSMHFLQ